MRKCFYSLLLLLSIQSLCRSQEVTARMLLADSLFDCGEIQYASMQLIPMYYQGGMYDTASRILDYWEKHCGNDETIYRTRVLWAIDSGTFSDTLISDETIIFLDLYQLLALDTSCESVLFRYSYYTPEAALLKWYKSFTDTLVSRAQQYQDLSPAETFFISFYHQPHDSLYSLIKEAPLETTKLFQVYNQPVNGTIQDPLFHASIGLGAWIPCDKLATLGTHPSINGLVGFRNKRAVANLGLQIRIGQSGNEYDVFYEDSLYRTDEFTGIGISLEGGRQLIRWRRHEFDLLGGIDLEMIKALTLENDPDDPDDDESKYLKSPSIHAGAGYRYYLKNERFIGLSGRYNLLNFKNNRGSNLRGNALSFTLEYGIGSNAWLHNRQTYLKERIPAGTSH